MLVLPVLVIASSNFVSCVMSRQNMTSNDAIIGRNTISPHYAYVYYDGQSSAPGISTAPYFSPGTHHHHYEGKLARCHRVVTRAQDVRCLRDCRIQSRISGRGGLSVSGLDGWKWPACRQVLQSDYQERP
jgi:hypothetical protein